MKKIIIIGGGISGLSILHHLKKRFKDSVDITLYEREASVGGTIRTVTANDCLFEQGPNGFLDNQPSTLELVNELGLTPQLIDANHSSKRRYIQLKGRLHQVPMGPLGFIQTPLLSPLAKCRLIQGLFIKNISTDKSIYDYTSERFGVQASERLADPVVSGIYAGNIKRLHMGAAFPKIFGIKKEKSPCMRSFKRGMGQLIEAFYLRYQGHIKTGHEITTLDQYNADLIILATPAYVSARLVEEINPALSHLLDKIPYAPVAVVGLSLKFKYFKKRPDGFGYLIPSTEKKDVLGVLIESNVFQGRSGEDQVMLRVILGGAHHPAIINDSPDQILVKAIGEINSTYGLKQKPIETFTKLWPRAIPQYELNYPDLRQAIARTLKQNSNLQLCANYLDGVSFNDCINNAKSIAGRISI